MASVNNSKNVANFIRRRKSNLIKVFHSKCCICGFDKYQEALEFHHVNPEEKEFQIGGGNTIIKALDKQLQELKKCILVCANCHRGIHAGYIEVPENYLDFYDEEVAQSLLDDLEDLKHHKIYYCKNCGKEISGPRAKYCTTCSGLLNRTVERPSREELKQLIRTMPFTRIGAKYDVTDNAIRKWCDAYGLPRKATLIKEISDEDWEKI